MLKGAPDAITGHTTVDLKEHLSALASAQLAVRLLVVRKGR